MRTLAQRLNEEFGVSVEDSTVGRVLRELGYRKLTARPRHYAQNVALSEEKLFTSPHTKLAFFRH